MKNLILRPAYNRPEMLQISIEYEIAARRFAGVSDEAYLTLFLLEYGADSKVVEIARSYPYPAEIRYRNRWWRFGKKRRYGITRSLLEGMKEGFGMADEYVIVIEDDILIHQSYFRFIDALLRINALKNYSAICAVGCNNNGDVHKVIKGIDYSPWAPLISKRFWEIYISKYANEWYYQNRRKTIVSINEENRKYWDCGYKMKGSRQYDNHDGLINRLVDVARIERGMVVVLPEVDRQMHIGVYGTNTPGKDIPGGSYEKRLENLKRIIKDDRLGDYSCSTEHEFNGFSPSLDLWDGTVIIAKNI